MNWILVLLPMLLLAETISLEDLEALKPERDFGTLPRENTSFASIQKAWDESDEYSGNTLIKYKPGQNIRLILREYMETMLHLPSWEKVSAIYIGDPTSIQATQIAKNLILLKPSDNIGVDTSLFLVGKYFVYVCYLRIEGANSKNLSDLMVYIQAKPKSAKELIAIAKGESKKLSFNFSIKGNRSITPSVAYHNGLRTFLHFPKGQDLTNIKVYQVHNNQRALVSFNIEDNFIEVDCVGDLVLVKQKKESWIKLLSDV